MAGKVGSTVVAEAVVLLLLFMNNYGVVKANDAAPIPAVKRQVLGWFSANVKPLAERKWLDPALVRAEAGPTKVIKVMQDGSGDFKTITEAVNSVPSGNTKRVIIFIGGGVYFERVTIEQSKPFVTLYGSPDDTPTLVFNGSNAEYGQEQGATLTVESDYFVGANLIIKNSFTFHKIIKGAQALRASGNKGSYYNCRFSGLQNTLFDDRGLHLFMDCYIEGLEDFIFGSGTSLYLNTELHVLAGPNIRSVITADTRRPHDNDHTPGYSFVHCTITGDAKNALLGRAWLSNPRVVFAYTDMGANNIIAPEGWFDNNPSEGNSTVYYAEYKNTGAGASTTRRVSYSKQLTDAEAKPFVTLGYIQGSKWLLPPPNL